MPGLSTGAQIENGGTALILGANAGAANLTLGWYIDQHGAIEQHAGSLTLAGNMVFGGWAGGSGSYLLDSGGTIAVNTVTGDLFLGRNMEAVGTYNLSSGTVTRTGTSP